MTPDVLAAVSGGQRSEFVSVFAGSLTTVILFAVPLVLVAFGLTWLLREEPLRSSAEPDDRGRELAAGSAPGTAEPEVEVVAGLLH